jgi:hypothetical protein
MSPSIRSATDRARCRSLQSTVTPSGTRPVREPHSLVIAGDAVYGRHRAEQLLGVSAHARSDIREHGRADEGS